jgi:hypothetical protein
VIAIWLAGCGSPPAPPAPVPPPAPTLPDVHCELPTREVRSPAAVPADAALTHAREVLVGVVRANDLDPGNPWAVVHGMLALGADVPLTDGRPAWSALFEDYAERPPGGGLAFPHQKGKTRVEPHTDLVLKALAEGGIPFDRPVTVAGRPATLDDLFRRSLQRTWVAGNNSSAGSWNDLPWTLQGVAACVPGDLAWDADGGHAMTIDGFTHAVVAKLHDETEFLRDAMASGTPVQKQKQGIFAYTCGGTHLIMGAAFAVARGHGEPGDLASIQAEVAPLLWRLDLELAAVDGLLPEHPEYTDMLLDQRLKFLGHLLETAHKMAAMGLFTPDEAQQATLARARTELVKTVAALEAAGLLAPEGLAAVKEKREQTWLDLIGDAAHAVRGIDLSTGEGAVRY